MMTPEEYQFVFNALEEGADPNLENEAGMTPLFLVIVHKRIDLVEALINNGADPNLPGALNDRFYSPLFLAVMHNDDEAVRILLSKGTNPNTPCVLNDQILTPLNLAIINNRLSLVELLVSNNTDILHRVDIDGQTPLYYACLSGNAQLVRYLIKLGANPYIDCRFDIIENFIKYTYPDEVSTACQLASDLYPECKIFVSYNTISNCFKALRIARDYSLPYLSGIFLNQIHSYYQVSPFHRRVINTYLAELGYPTVKFPRQPRARPWFSLSSSDSDSDDGKYFEKHSTHWMAPYSTAISKNEKSEDSSDEFDSPYEASSPIDKQYAVNTEGGYTFDLYTLLKWQTIRHIQHAFGETEDCIRYINPYTKVPFTSRDTTFIRMKARSLGVELSFDPTLLSHACVKLFDKMQITSFCHENNFNAIKSFLYGSSDEIDLPKAYLAMSIAVKSGNSDLVKFLLELGISPDYSDAGYQPLITAAINGHIDIMKLLLQFRANPSVKYIYSDMTVMTPLYFAVTNENDPHGKMLEMLIKSGADVSEKLCPEGTTALWEAVFFGYVQKAKLLVKAGADVNACKGEYTILQAAIWSSKATDDMIQYLLSVGADPSAKNKAGEDALAFAKRMGRFEEIITNHLQKIESRKAECAISCDDVPPIAARSSTFIPLMNAASKSGMKLDVSNDDFIESAFGKSSVNRSRIKRKVN